MMMLSFEFNRLPSLFTPARIKVPGTTVYEVEEKPEKRARTVKHLLRANHTNYSVIYHNLQFHNHTPHILGSAYILGASSEHLNEVYKVESESLEPWEDSPREINEQNWRDFFGNREYQRAYLDFFEDQLTACGNDWKALIEKFLFSGKEPLINNIVCGLGHSLIHLGYAYELLSRTIAPEALTLATCFYNFMHKYLDDPGYTAPSKQPSDSPLDIIRERVANDARFDGIFEHPGDNNIFELFEWQETAVLEHWNALDTRDPTAMFAKCQKLAVAIVVATHEPGTKYDFFLVHLLTTSHAIRILLPLLPTRWHVAIVRQWWLFTVAVYIAQLRPAIDMERVEKFDLQDRDWDFVVNQALEGNWKNDPHYVKALRAMRDASETWGDEGKLFLKSAVKYAVEFDGWGGFGALDTATTN